MGVYPHMAIEITLSINSHLYLMTLNSPDGFP